MKKNVEILYGVHSVFEALKANKRSVNKIFISKKRSIQRAEKIIDFAKTRNVPIEYTDLNNLDKLTGRAKHQGIAAKTDSYPIRAASELLEKLENSTEPCLILILENIEDPHNLGALIRTSICAGVDYILIPKNRSVSPSASVSRSSAGAMEHADIYILTNTASFLKSLKKTGVWIAGLDAQGTTPVFQSDMQGRFALIIGGEHKGIRPLVKKQCDYLLSIPVLGEVNSLNASVAGGIAMYEAFRQRTIKNTGEI